MYQGTQSLPQNDELIITPAGCSQDIQVIPHEEAERLQEEARIKFKDAFELLKDL